MNEIGFPTVIIEKKGVYDFEKLSRMGAALLLHPGVTSGLAVYFYEDLG